MKCASKWTLLANILSKVTQTQRTCMVCTCLEVDIRNEVQDNHATIHRPKLKEGPKGNA